MSILVTGGAGFIGANFVWDWLAQSDETVINLDLLTYNLDLLTYAGNRENLASLASDERHVVAQGDIGDSSLEAQLLALHQPRAISNFAAESHVDPEVIIGRHVTFVQDHHSRSAKNVLRGLHYQIRQPQDKLVRVVQGEVFDVAVDIRQSSPTFGRWVGEILSAENKRPMWMPEGFAHGFVVLSDTAEFLYKTTDYYAPEHERCIAWNDPAIAIPWPLNDAPALSAKDQRGKSLAEAECFV